MSALQILRKDLDDAFSGSGVAILVEGGELTITVPTRLLGEHMKRLRDDSRFQFSQLIDVCGVDYDLHPDRDQLPGRFCVVYHLLSMEFNVRLRVKCFCEDEMAPSVKSVTEIWSGANWFEREAFDLFGIVFEGHPDLRRILTDYGFVGHPLRKDFPLSGHVEMRYDPEKRKVIYQPVTIEPREIVPRVTREDTYGDV